jgi:L-iditol 2-dehydrogenase
LPDTCTYEQAALAEPLSVVLHAARRVGLVASPAETLLTKTGITSFSRKIRVLVIGTGAVGFLAAALIRTLSDLGETKAPVAHVAAMDIDSRKLVALRKAGYADSTFTVPQLPQDSPPLTQEESLKRSKELAYQALDDMAIADKGARAGYDFVFECTGVESCIQMGIYVRVFGLSEVPIPTLTM